MKVETYHLPTDLVLMVHAATSFPEGILASHQALHHLVPYSKERRYLGLSRPEKGMIVYYAAAETLGPEEPAQLALETLVLPKGNYCSVMVADYQAHPLSFKQAFDFLIQQPNLDPQGYCIEWYLSEKEARCMVRVID